MSNRAAIVGAGTYGEVYLHYLRESGVEIAFFLDDDERKHGKRVDDVEVLGSFGRLSQLKDRIDSVYVPIGSNPVRRRLLAAARAAGLATPDFIHSRAIVASDLQHGAGCYVLPGAVIMPKVRLGDAVMISMGAHVAHHTVLDDGVFLSTGASVGAGITVGEDAYLGMSSTAVTGKCKVIGAGAMIGSCSNVISDVTAGVTVAGNPARIIRKAP